MIAMLPTMEKILKVPKSIPTVAQRRFQRFAINLIPDDITPDGPLFQIKPQYKVPIPLGVGNHIIISHESINLITHQVWSGDHDHFLPTKLAPFESSNLAMSDLEHFAGAGVINPTTGETITKYRTLVKYPETREIWMLAFRKELGGLAQGYRKTNTKGTNTVFFMEHAAIQKIPKDHTVTYVRIMVNFRPQKKYPNRVRITFGGNLINYPGELTTGTAELITSKIIWDSVLSTQDAKFMTLDIKLFYLNTPLDRYEYMKMPIGVIPQHIIDQYDLSAKAKNGFVVM